MELTKMLFCVINTAYLGLGLFVGFEAEKNMSRDFYYF